MAAIPAIVLVWIFGGVSFILHERGAAGMPDTVLVEESTIGSFHHATRLTISPQGGLYIVDGASNALVFIDGKTAKVTTVGGYGWTSATFDRPSSVSTDGLNVYVADEANHRIQRFDRNLNFISSFSTRDTSYVSARFGFPAGAALSRQGDLFILDTENQRVVKFNSRSQFERSFGGIDQERGRIRQPVKIVVSPSDRVFVLEPDRVLEFDYVGNHIRTVGEGVLRGAIGMDITENTLLVAAADTLYWFTPSGQLGHLTPVRFILTSLPLAPVQDVAVTRDRFYILGRERVHVFRMMEEGR